MNRLSTLFLTALFLASPSIALAADPHAELVTRLRAVVRAHFKDADITDAKGVFTAKYHTMMYRPC